ncbi:hypothetical protein GQ457_01G044830 [Hibiscus cannabinus]
MPNVTAFSSSQLCDYKEHDYCDVCEGERLWYYRCSNCDTYAHSNCVLGPLPLIKDGTRVSSHHGHDHDLLFFRKVDCSRCDKLCPKEILKCRNSTCNYIIIIHFDCWFRY